MTWLAGIFERNQLSIWLSEDKSYVVGEVSWTRSTCQIASWIVLLPYSMA